MWEKLTNLIFDIENVIALTLTAVTSYLAISGKMNMEQFMLIALLVFQFYFKREGSSE